MSNAVSQFLRRDVNKAFAQVTADYVNRGVGYGLEVPLSTGILGQNLTLGNFRVAFYS